MSSMDDFKKFINRVGDNVEKIVMGPSQMMNNITSSLTSPVMLPLIIVGGGLLVLKFIEVKR